MPFTARPVSGARIFFRISTKPSQLSFATHGGNTGRDTTGTLIPLGGKGGGSCFFFEDEDEDEEACENAVRSTVISPLVFSFVLCDL